MTIDPPLHEGLHPVIVRSPPLTVKVKPLVGEVGSAIAVAVQTVTKSKGTITAIAENRIFIRCLVRPTEWSASGRIWSNSRCKLRLTERDADGSWE